MQINFYKYGVEINASEGEALWWFFTLLFLGCFVFGLLVQ